MSAGQAAAYSSAPSITNEKKHLGITVTDEQRDAILREAEAMGASKIVLMIFAQQKARYLDRRQHAQQWVRASGPPPGAVAMFARGRRGGHVAIVHDVRPDGTVIYLNPSSQRQAWQVGPYGKRPIAYRIAG